MSMKRRCVLKGMALSGAALTLGRWDSALAAPIAPRTAATTPVRVFTDGGAAESLFLQGARAAGGTLLLEHIGRDTHFILALERQLRSGEPLRLIGLLDDAAATLVVDMARSSGARMRWLGQHSAVGKSSRHYLLEADGAAGCARQLGQQLTACGADFMGVAENAQGESLPLAGSALGGAGAAQWASTLGYLLAGLHTPRRLGSRAPEALTPVSGNFVSFSIETRSIQA